MGGRGRVQLAVQSGACSKRRVVEWVVEWLAVDHLW